jgi:Flp pilus assembly protein TadG
MLNAIRKFRKSESGVSAIEFALIIPVMLTTFFGVSEIANYILAARKVANVASTTGNTTAEWSEARNIAPRAPGSSVTIPNIISPGQSVIMAEVSFTYQTLFGEYLTSGMTVSDTFYLKPRRSTKVERQ